MHIVRWLAAVLLLLAGTAVADAQSLMERLVMPGDLAAAHADLQKDCSNCHVDFEKGAQAQLCLDCHKEVRADIAAGTGFHGRSKEAQASECSHCHTDHKGRDIQIVLMDPDTFDHAQTDFPLLGAHTQAACAGCHASAKPFRAAETGCIDCHRDDDRHDGALGQDCATCHKSTAWAEVTAFDHSKTDFPLTNAHEKVSCTQCHAGEIYEDLPTTCIGCHRIQDVHDDRFGAKCETCHENTKWTEIRFDHDRDTKFRLDGAHREAGCNECHSENVFDHPTDSDCATCHVSDDPHRGALGSRCSDCHSAESWIENVRFDHDFTDFPLIGQHAALPCEACHFDPTYQVADTGCVACHASDDVHKARLGPACETCHNPNGWNFWLFDHNRQTNFALTGAHEGLRCESCHRQPVEGAPTLPRSCIGCHSGDDVHKGRFGTNCSACHSTSTFKGARLKVPKN